MDDMNFTINIENDEKILSKFPAPNMGDLIFNWLSPNLRQKLYEINQSNYNKGYVDYLMGVRYEYGIDMEIDLNRALEYYYKAADENEPLSLYKLYTIHKCENEKFKINRDKNYEMFYLFKSFAYSEISISTGKSYAHIIDVILELATILDIEDPLLEKSNTLFINMKYKVKNPAEVKYVEAMTLIKFNLNEDDISIGISMLHDLADNDNYIDAIIRLACLYSNDNKEYIKNKDTKLSLKYFKIIEDSKVYKAYDDYGAFLYNESNIEKCKEILKEGTDKGNMRCYFLLYELVLIQFNFDTDNIYDLCDLLEIAIRDIINGNIFYLFEFFYLYRILTKRFKINSDNYPKFAVYEKYKDELINMINTINNNKIYKTKIFKEGTFESEFLFTYGYTICTGLNGDIDTKTGLDYFKQSYKLASILTYKRFCYSYIFKLVKKNFLKDQTEELKAKLDKTKNKLFKIFYESLDQTPLHILSSSYFYYFAKLYHHGHGVKSDDIHAYCYYHLAAHKKPDMLGYGSIISFYRKYKASKILNEEKFIKLENELEAYKKKEISGNDDDGLCYICFDNPKDLIFYPCKHLLCTKCYNEMKECTKCPTCRGRIIIVK